MSTLTTLTNPTAIKQLVDWTKENIVIGGYTYAIMFQNKNGSFHLHPVTLAPCFGELRPYYEAGDETYRPRDLRHPWPKTGTPVGVGVVLSHWAVTNNEFTQFYWGDFSPFKAAVGPKVQPGRILIEKDGVLKAIVFLNTKINPDIFVNSLQNMRSVSDSFAATWEILRSGGLTRRESFFAVVSAYLEVTKEIVSLSTASYQTFKWYYLRHPDIDYFLQGNPPEGVKTLFERGAYRRPVIESIYMGPRPFKSLPVSSELKKRGSLTLQEFSSLLKSSIN